MLGISALVYSGWLTLAIPALNFLYYCAMLGGMLLAWRFHSSRIFWALCVLFLAQGAIVVFGAGEAALLSTTVRMVAVLVPLDFVLIVFLQERGFTLESVMPVALFLFVQCIIVAAACRSAESKVVFVSSSRNPAPAISLPDYAFILLVATCGLLLVRFFLTHKPVDIALLWSLAAFFLSLHFAGSPRLGTLYSATAACILGAAMIENSYILAYHDELTALPSRRAFNDALLRLQEPYSIAVVDIDHFKQFNDRYGHDTGDQVLQMVASNLARVTGGGRAYRCGGEEFNIVFPGKNTPEVLQHLETLRKTIASSEFRMRAGDRRQMPRGPDRRNQKARRRTSKGKAIREIVDSTPRTLSVTVSIGAASSSKTNSVPEDVIQAADKALYRAKANGRNRVESAYGSGRPRTKAAGIA